MQVFQIIRNLAPEEIRDIRIILRSDWFNYRDDVRLLFDFLVKTAAKKQSDLPDKSLIFKQIFPGKESVDDRLLRLAGSWLTDAIEDYFRWKAVLENPVFGNTQLVLAYRKHNLPALARKKSQLAREILEKQPHRNAEYFRASHELFMEEFQADAATKRTEAFNLQVLGDSLDNWFFAQKLKQVCVALSHQTVFKTEYRFGFLQSVLEHVEQVGLTEIPAIGLYFYYYKVLSQPENEAAFAVFREKIAAHGGLFPEGELRDLYVMAINFCTRRVNEGSRAHIREGFELYRNGFERGVFVINGVLSRFTYRNATALGLMLKELDWVADFLPRFRDFLEKPYRENTFSFSIARLEYERGNFNEALVLLQNAEYEDLLATLSAKTLVLKILYETSAFDALISHLDAMRIFIRRHKEIGYHRENYLNLIRFTQRLVALQFVDKEAVARFLSDLGSGKKVAEKDWLLSKSATN